MSFFPELQTHCMSFEGAVEEYPWEDHVGWKVKGKLFAISDPGGVRVTVKSTPERQQALITHPDISVAAYVGRYGWVSVELVSEQTLAIAVDLVTESYSLVAKRRKSTAR